VISFFANFSKYLAVFVISGFRRSVYEIFFFYDVTQRILVGADDSDGDRGSKVVQVLCYKSEGRWFDPSWCHWNFSLTYNPSDSTVAL